MKDAAKSLTRFKNAADAMLEIVDELIGSDVLDAEFLATMGLDIEGATEELRSALAGVQSSG